MADDIDTVITGDCLEVMRGMESGSVDLVVTSPPYADARKSTYGGVPAAEYVDWFTPISLELLRVLRPTGSFVLNIKERVTDGQRSTYVIDLIKRLQRQGWLWIEEYIWHKKNSFPGKWPNRFRDGWERCLHFSKQLRPYMDQESVMVDIGAWNASRKITPKDARFKSGTGSGMTFDKTVYAHRRRVYPDNVLHMPTVCHNSEHPAAFPLTLPDFFIRLFSHPAGVVLDPFLGSGTTAVAAVQLRRHYVGIEKSAKYAEMARKRIAEISGQEVLM